jgi:RNA polymerase sigma-70 factor, ECF subfamily
LSKKERHLALAPAPLGLATDAALVEAARGGDREAFGRLFRQYAPMVHGILLSKVSSSEADDLVQDVFLSALERLHSLQKAGSFGGWLAAIARNRAVDFHRGRKVTVALPEDLGRRDPDRAEAEQILTLIRNLPEAYRETLILRLVEGMTGPEIAVQVGLTPDSVRVNLHRGMQLLRARLEEER